MGASTSESVALELASDSSAASNRDGQQQLIAVKLRSILHTSEVQLSAHGDHSRSNSGTASTALCRYCLDNGLEFSTCAIPHLSHRDEHIVDALPNVCVLVISILV